MKSENESLPRVCVFLYSFTGGGAEKMMVKICNELYDRNYDVDIVTVDATGPYRSLVDNCINVNEIAGSNILEIQYNLIKYLGNSCVDVLLSTMEIPNIVSVLAGKVLSISTVLRIANVNSNKNRVGKYKLIPYIKKLTYPHADSIIAISDGVASDLTRITDIDKNQIRTIHNPAYDPNILTMSDKETGQEWLNNKQKKVIIGVGNMKPQKDFSTLLKAVNRIDDKDLYLIILGKGPLKDQLKHQARELGIRDRVMFPGFVKNPYAYMAKANVFVLSSLWEGFGNVIVEAMACQTPVVCTDCPGGPAEILDNGTYGSLVPVGDDVSMAKAIEEMLQNPTDKKLLMSRAKDFSIENIVDLYEKELLSVNVK